MRIINVIITLFALISLIGCSNKGDISKKNTDNINVITIEEKLNDLDYTSSNNIYSKEVIEQDVLFTYEIDTLNNVFKKYYDNTIEKEEYIFNYEDSYFVYNYYIEGVIYIQLTYDYIEEEVISDEDNIYEVFKLDIENMKDQFLNLLKEKNININDL